MRQPKISSNQCTEERILSNALQHFCNYGYNGTSVREITTASEVTKPTLYYYFKNKEELFTKLAQSCFEMVVSNLSDQVARQATFEGALKALFDSMDHVFTKNPSALKFIHGVIVAPQRGAPEVGAKSFLSSLENTVLKIIEKAVHSGECLKGKEGSIQTVISALLGFHTKNVITGVNADSGDKAKIESVISMVVSCARNPNCPQLLIN